MAADALKLDLLSLDVVSFPTEPETPVPGQHLASVLFTHYDCSSACRLPTNRYELC